MSDNDTLMQFLEAGARRRAERRRFMQLAGGATLAVGLAGCGGGSSSATPTPTPTPTPTVTSTVAVDSDYLNFALNFEYLEAQYYLRATTGSGIEAIPASTSVPGGGTALLTGVGTQGTVTGGSQVTFSSTLIGEYAREIASAELAHVAYLRSMIGAAASSAQPAIDLSTGAGSGFAGLAARAGIAGFNPYSSDQSFLLGAFLLEDVIVTAYRGLLPLLSNALYVNAVAGILATESYHAALIRSQLYAMGSGAQTAAGQFSDARDSLDGPSDDDQGIAGTATVANIVPADANGIVYARTTGQVLNIFYNNNAAVALGGFFPAGINNNFLATSAAN